MSLKRSILRPRRSRGQALVEFALVIPLLLLLIFGLIDLGRAVYVNNSLSEAAREGARWGSVQARSATNTTRQDIADYTVGRLTSVPGASANAICIRPGTVVLPCSFNNILRVEVETDLEMITPIIGQLMSAAGLNPLHLSATSEVVVNN